MNNFDVARQALEVSANSSGSAMREHEKWSQSLEARLNKLKSTWQSLSQSFMSSDFLKSVLDGVIALVNGLDKLIDTFGTLPTLVTTFASGMSLFKGKGFLKVTTDELTGFATGIETTFKRVSNSVAESLSKINLKNGFRQTLNSDDIAAVRNYVNAINRGVSSTTAFEKCMGNASDAAKEYAKSKNAASDGVAGFIKQQQLSNVSTLAQNKSLGNAKTLLKEYHNGCKSTGIAQSDFANAVKQTNPQLASAMTTTNSVKAGMKAYTASLIGAKIKTVALTAATTLLNAALTMGISLIISGVVSAISKWANQEEELAEKVAEVTSKFKEQHNELKKLQGDYDTSNESSMVSKYGKLSKGVDSLGRNVSLTADEYSEYQGIVNKIAEQIPSLVPGYDSQGNAILSCKGNVEELTTAYEKLIHAQNTEILSNAGNIEDNFANTLKKFSGEHGQSDGHGFWKGLITSGTGEENFVQKFFDYELKGDTVKSLEKLLDGTGKYNKDDVFKELKNNTFSESEIRTLLKNADVDINYSDDAYEVLEKTLETNPAKIKNAVDNYYTQFADAIKEEKTIAQAKLSEAFDVGDTISGLNYGNISEELQQIAHQTVDSLDFDFFSELSQNGQSFGDWIDNMLDQLNALDKTDSAQIEAAFDLQTKFNGGDISYGEYVKGIQNTSNLIDGLDLSDEVKNQIKLTLNTDEVTDNYEALKKRLTEKYELNMETEKAEKKAEKFLSGLSASEYQVAVDLIDDPNVNFNDFDSIKELRKYIKEQAKFNEAMNFTIAMDVETESLGALNTAMAESVSGAGLSSEAIAALKGRYAELESQGYDLSSMFEETANGIHLNKRAVNEFEQALASQKLSKTQDNLDVLQDRYDELTTEINNCTDASKRASLYREQQSILDKINDLGTLAAQYEGLTSAYNAWLAAEEAGSERDMYEKVIEGFETVGDEIKRGWIDDGTIKFLELMTGETDLATKSASELKKIWDGLDNKIKNTSYSVSDFFTTDEDGNSTSTGVYNFLNAIQELESSDTVSSVLGKQFKDIEGIENLVEKKDGKVVGFNFDVVGGDEAIAEALGISEELVQIMLRAADDAGFVVTLDGNWTQFADLKNQAETSNDALKKLAQTNDDLKKAGFGDYDFDFGASSLETLEEELTKAKELLNNDAFKGKDGKFNIDAKGAKDALKIAETLQIAKNKLEEPAYMSIDTSKLQKGLQEPVEQLQEFERLTQERDLLNLTGEDTKRLKEIDGELDKIATNLSNLDEQTKIKLGIEGMTPEQIRKELENGTIEVPAQLTIEANMDKSLEGLLTLGLLEKGFITEKEAKIRLGIEVENKDDVNQEIEDEIKDGNDKTIKLDKKFKITAETSGIDKVEELKSKLEGLDGLDDKTIETIATVIGQMDVDKLKTTLSLINPVHVQAIAEAIGKGDVDGLKEAINNLHPAHVQAIAEALGFDDVNELNIAIESLDPKTVEAVANAIGITDVESLKAAIDNVKGKDVDVNASTSGESKLSGLKSLIDSIKSKTVTITSWFKKITSGGSTRNDSNGFSDVDGTANVNGTAFANGTSGRAFKQGYWGTKDSGVALGNELGMETIVRDGHYFTIGDGNAQFFKYKKGDIIFNHKQTEELFKHGKVTSGGGHGKVYANGTAFSKGTGGGLLPEVKSYTVKADTVKVESKKTETKSSTSSKTKTSTSSKSKSSSSSTKDDFEETFDLIEVKISRLERAIDRLDKKANGTWRSWTSRNKALTSEISKVNEEINLQEKAYSAYMKEANSVGLSSSWKKKVQNGTLDISTVKDEKLAEKIKDYQTYYEAALQCKDTILELKDAEAELYKQKFENVQARFDGILQGYEHTETMLNEYIAQAEAQGHIVSTKYYDELIKNEKAGIKQLQKEQAELVAKRDEWLAAGGSKDSQDWRDMCADIDAVTQAIEEGRTSLLEYNKAIRDIEWETFELAQERISDIASEADFFIELLSNSKLHDDNGQLTDEGKATMGLHGQNYNVYMRQADDYGAKAAELTRQIEETPFDQDLIKQRDSYLKLQQESILEAENEKQAIKDLVEEGINLELEALQERIDKQNESLQSAKDLYDYNKKVKDQTKEIASLEKQMSAYQGDDSEESQMKIQEIKVALEEAKENLQETEYDKYISDQSALLDNLYNEYETILNSRLDNIDGLISDTIASINENAGAIAETIYGASDSVGYNMSESMKTIWGEAYKQVQADSATRVSQLTGAVNSLITNGLITKEQGNSLITSLGDGSTGSATATLNRIKEMLANGEIGQADANELIASLSLGDQEQVKASLNSMNDWVADKKMSQQDADAITKAFVTGNADDIKNANNLLNSLVKNGTLTASDVKGITNALKGSQVKGDNVVTEYGKDFGKKDTKVNDAVDEVKKKVNDAVKASDKEAKKNINKNSTSTSAKKDPTKDNKKSTTTKKNTTTTKTTATNKGDGDPEVGDKVKFVSGEYYYSSDGLKPKGTKNLGKDVYITKINTKSWATHPYHISTGKKLGSGDLGWLKLKQLKGYASGKKNFLDDEIAWTQEKGQEFIIRPSDGAILTPVAKGDSVLNATASGNIWSMANNPAEFIKNNLGLDSANVPNAANVNNSIVQNFENITFSMPNVHDYSGLLKEMKSDPNFERLILSMTIDRVVGKSALAKGKAIR